MKPIYAVELLIEKIKKDYRDDVALVVIMGSTIYADTHSRSDIDMYFVPKTERGHNLESTFIIDGIGFDFWGIPWERLEHIAHHEERIVSIVQEGTVLYCASEEDRERFERLRARALDTGDPHRFLSKASARLAEAYQEHYRLRRAESLSQARSSAIGIIYKVTEAIALINRISVKRGRGKLKGEILNMSLVPEGFAGLYDTVFVSDDIAAIQRAYGQLLDNAQALLQAEDAKARQTEPFVDVMIGFYEELINSYNKIFHACEIGDSVTPLFAAVELVHEIGQVFALTGTVMTALPDLVAAYDPAGLPCFARAAEAQQRAFERLLQTRRVPVRIFAGYDELAGFLNSL